MITVRVDDRYRIVLPKEARSSIQPGDVLVFEERVEGGTEVLRFAKALDPFDALIELDREEARRGEEIPLEVFAQERGLDPAALRLQRGAWAALAEEAIAEDRRGETISLEDYAKKNGVDLDTLPADATE